jgi:Holliday junction resolvase
MQQNIAFTVSCSPSWSDLGRSAEIQVAILLALCGWNVRLSPGSRGPADIFAQRKTDKWLIQVKSSGKFGRLKSSELKQLKSLAARANGLPVIALVQPRICAPVQTKRQILTDDTTRAAAEHAGLKGETANFPTTSHGVFFHSIVDWTIKEPL